LINRTNKMSIKLKRNILGGVIFVRLIVPRLSFPFMRHHTTTSIAINFKFHIMVLANTNVITGVF
jgi:hypothetical protein